MKVYEDDDDRIVYLYYFDNELYAWTTDKKDKREFEKLRNMKVFKKRKQEFNPIQFRAFMQVYKLKQIIEIPLRSKGENLIIFGTYYEDNKLTDFSENLLSKLEELEIYFGGLSYYKNLPEKYDRALRTLLDYQGINKKTKINEFYMNAWSAFYMLFKNTF